MLDEWFVKIVERDGYPVALFQSRLMDIETGRTDRTLPREALLTLIKNTERQGESAEQYKHALQALEEAIQKWAQTPWDGR